MFAVQQTESRGWSTATTDRLSFFVGQRIMTTAANPTPEEWGQAVKDGKRPTMPRDLTREERIAYLKAAGYDKAGTGRRGRVIAGPNTSTESPGLLKARSNYHKALNQLMRFGAESFVKKLGREWLVTVNGDDVPLLYKTKREAMEMAEKVVGGLRLRVEILEDEEETR